MKRMARKRKKLSNDAAGEREMLLLLKNTSSLPLKPLYR